MRPSQIAIIVFIGFLEYAMISALKINHDCTTTQKLDPKSKCYANDKIILERPMPKRSPKVKWTTIPPMVHPETKKRHFQSLARTVVAKPQSNLSIAKPMTTITTSKPMATTKKPVFDISPIKMAPNSGKAFQRRLMPSTAIPMSQTTPSSGIREATTKRLFTTMKLTTTLSPRSVEPSVMPADNTKTSAAMPFPSTTESPKPYTLIFGKRYSDSNEERYKITTPMSIPHTSTQIFSDSTMASKLMSTTMAQALTSRLHGTGYLDKLEVYVTTTIKSIEDALPRTTEKVFAISTNPGGDFTTYPVITPTETDDNPSTKMNSILPATYAPKLSEPRRAPKTTSHYGRSIDETKHKNNQKTQTHKIDPLPPVPDKNDPDLPVLSNIAPLITNSVRNVTLGNSTTNVLAFAETIDGNATANAVSKVGGTAISKVVSEMGSQALATAQSIGSGGKADDTKTAIATAINGAGGIVKASALSDVTRSEETERESEEDEKSVRSSVDKMLTRMRL